MTVPLLTALDGAPWEPDVVAALDRPTGPLRVVRRCVDLADLLATAPTGIARAALLSTHLRRLDRDALARLASAGVAPIGLVDAGDPAAGEHLRGLGIRHVVAVDTPPDVLARIVTAAVEAGAGTAVREWIYADPATGLAPEIAPEDVAQEPADPSPTGAAGRVMAVWGPTGAPGRTTLATALAGEVAATGRSTLLADADVYGGTVAQHLGLLGDPPGLPAAARLAGNGALDQPSLDRLAPHVTPHLRVLAGISRAERWLELRPAALESVWSLARSLAEVVLVDCAFNLEQEEELSFDVAAPRRNGATLTTLECADVIVAVGAADPVGLARLIRGLAQLREVVPGAEVRVVLNKVRKGPIGSAPEKQLRMALAHYAGERDIHLVPYDVTTADAALLQGQTWAEAAPRSAARLAVTGLAASLIGAPAEGRLPGRGLLRRRAWRTAGAVHA